MNELNYYDLDELRFVYLEDSYLLELKESPKELELIIDAVLTEEHPEYSEPPPSENYCYKKAKISFSNVKAITWIEKKMFPFCDANNEIDYGNIENFSIHSKDYHISGDWGKVIISEPNFKFEILKTV